MKKTFKFDFKNNEFVIENGNPVTVSGVDALMVWIEKILRTPFGKHKIYRGTSYGTNIEDLVIGKSYGAVFTDSELKREINSALLQNEDILSVKNIAVNHNNSSVLSIEITLNTTYGEVSYAYDN